MDTLIAAYHQLLHELETFQKSGRFTLHEASVMFQHLVSVKSGIEAAQKAPVAAAAAAPAVSASDEELENTKVELISKNILNSNLKRDVQARERLLNLIRNKLGITEADWSKLEAEAAQSA